MGLLISHKKKKTKKRRKKSNISIFLFTAAMSKVPLPDVHKLVSTWCASMNQQFDSLDLECNEAYVRFMGGPQTGDFYRAFCYINNIPTHLLDDHEELICQPVGDGDTEKEASENLEKLLFDKYIPIFEEILCYSDEPE
jgi:hypothetical protein